MVRTFVITGATSGIGRAAAQGLAATGANLILVGRRQPAGAKLAAALQRCRGAGRIDFLRADLSDQEQVRGLASAISAEYDRVDVLINNAGARFNHFQRSRDGIELTFATNHLSHFLLTHLLLGHLRNAQNARVITVGSGAHSGAGAEEPWCLGPDNYDRKLAYSKSKLANIMFAFELARRLKGTGMASNAVDPGGVATNLGRNNGLLCWLRHLVYYASRGELLTPRKGAETLVFLATSSSVNGITESYFRQKCVVEPSAPARDVEAAGRLWLRSLDLTHLTKATLPASAS